MKKEQVRIIARRLVMIVLTSACIAGAYVLLSSVGTFDSDIITITVEWKQTLIGLLLIKLSVDTYKYLFEEGRKTK